MYAKHKRKNFIIFLIYFFICFPIINNLLSKLFLEADEIKFEDPEPFHFSNLSLAICKMIDKVEVEDEIITVFYKDKLPVQDELIIISHFSLFTSWVQCPIFFPLGSGSFVNKSKNSVSFTFFLPVVDRYSGELICAQMFDKDAQKSKPNTKQQKHSNQNVTDISERIITTFNIYLDVRKFELDDIGYDYSRFKCHHKHSFDKRWCEFHNIGYIPHNLYFFSPAFFSFPSSFIVPGVHAPPFDRFTDRIINEPVVIQYKALNVPKQLTKEKKFCYITGTFHNFFMLWHVLFDFIIPIYNFINIRKGTDSLETRKIYVRSDGLYSFPLLSKVLTNDPIEILWEKETSLLMESGIIGLEKIETNPNPYSSFEDSILFHYEYNRSTVKGLREKMLEIIDEPPESYGFEKKPLIILIDRGEGTRKILNIDELHNHIEETCKFCQVLKIDLSNLAIENQIKIISKSSVLIGAHGSGLAHVLWMHESIKNHTTHLIEIMPYNYTCRDWYHGAANISGVNYHMVMNKHPPEETTDPRLLHCWSDPEYCPHYECHDLIRDQNIKLELETFDESFLKIVNSLKTTVATN